MLNFSSTIIKKAKELGASLAGIAHIDDLKTAPSFTFAPKLVADSIGNHEHVLKEKQEKGIWPNDAKSVLVIAVEHPADKPEMDWWFPVSGPPGNRFLTRIITEMCTWVEKVSGIRTFHMPYQVERGGTYLKDVSVWAGLGCIGKNNLLVTPEYGPRVRLRAMTLNESFPSTGPLGFDPCIGCDTTCRQACPQDAFVHQVYKTEEDGLDRLPGRDGSFSRPMCNTQMSKNITAAEEKKIEDTDKAVKVVKYCRCCEFACSVGK